MKDEMGRQAQTAMELANMFPDSEISFCSKKHVLYQISIYAHKYNV
jgi:hypothetical protein